MQDKLCQYATYLCSRPTHYFMFICLFKDYRPTRKFFIHLETSSLPVKAANDLCSALMVNKHWGFFSVPHLLWHRTSIYNGHLRGPVTLTPIAERLAVELSLTCVKYLSLSRLGFEHPIRVLGRALTDSATAAAATYLCQHATYLCWHME